MKEKNMSDVASKQLNKESENILLERRILLSKLTEEYMKLETSELRRELRYLIYMTAVLPANCKNI